MVLCPPGFLCINNGIAAIAALFIIATFYYLMYLVNSTKKEVYQKTIVNTQQDEVPEQPVLLFKAPERQHRRRDHRALAALPRFDRVHARGGEERIQGRRRAVHVGACDEHVQRCLQDRQAQAAGASGGADPAGGGRVAAGRGTGQFGQVQGQARQAAGRL